MNDLTALRAQHEELGRQIAAAEQDAAAAYADGLDSIQSGLRAWAASADLVIAETQRKNVLSLHVNGVNVRLGYPSERTDWGTWFGIYWGDGSKAAFSGTLPPAAAVIQFVKELLLAYPADDPKENDR